MQIFSPYKTVNMYFFFPRQQNKANPEATITNTTYISGQHQSPISWASLNFVVFKQKTPPQKAFSFLSPGLSFYLIAISNVSFFFSISWLDFSFKIISPQGLNVLGFFQIRFLFIGALKSSSTLSLSIWQCSACPGLPAYSRKSFPDSEIASLMREAQCPFKHKHAWFERTVL